MTKRPITYPAVERVRGQRGQPATERAHAGAFNVDEETRRREVRKAQAVKVLLMTKAAKDPSSVLSSVQRRLTTAGVPVTEENVYGKLLAWADAEFQRASEDLRERIDRETRRMAAQAFPKKTFQTRDVRLHGAKVVAEDTAEAQEYLKRLETELRGRMMRVPVGEGLKMVNLGMRPVTTFQTAAMYGTREMQVPLRESKGRIERRKGRMKFARGGQPGIARGAARIGADERIVNLRAFAQKLGATTTDEEAIYEALLAQDADDTPRWMDGSQHWVPAGTLPAGGEAEVLEDLIDDDGNVVDEILIENEKGEVLHAKRLPSEAEALVMIARGKISQPLGEVLTQPEQFAETRAPWLAPIGRSRGKETRPVVEGSLKGQLHPTPEGPIPYTTTRQELEAREGAEEVPVRTEKGFRKGELRFKYFTPGAEIEERRQYEPIEALKGPGGAPYESMREYRRETPMQDPGPTTRRLFKPKGRTGKKPFMPAIAFASESAKGKEQLLLDTALGFLTGTVTQREYDRVYRRIFGLNEFRKFQADAEAKLKAAEAEAEADKLLAALEPEGE